MGALFESEQISVSSCRLFVASGGQFKDLLSFLVFVVLLALLVSFGLCRWSSLFCWFSSFFSSVASTWSFLSMCSFLVFVAFSRPTPGLLRSRPSALSRTSIISSAFVWNLGETVVLDSVLSSFLEFRHSAVDNSSRFLNSCSLRILSSRFLPVFWVSRW